MLNLRSQISATQRQILESFQIVQSAPASGLQSVFTSEVVWYGGLQSVFKWRKIKCSRRSGLIMGTIIRIQRPMGTIQETWVLLADELWTEDNGNDAVCNGNCMRNDYRLRIVRAISMNRELESSMVQCNDHRSARQIKKSTCGQVDMNLCYNYHCPSTVQ